MSDLFSNIDEEKNQQVNEDRSTIESNDSFSHLISSFEIEEDIEISSSDSLSEENPFSDFSDPEQDLDYNKNLLDGMNPEQKEAIVYDRGSLLVLAGAGSGKTRVITHRFAYLIKKYQLDIDNILCVTFTNKAAGEMKERIGDLLRVNTYKAWIKTFHSMCALILRQHALRIGYTEDFTIYDASDTRNTVKKILESLKINPQDYPEKAIIKLILSSKDQLIYPQDLEKRARSEFDHVCIEVYKKYQDILKQNQAMDFSDLIGNTIILLEQCQDVREHYQKKWHFIMADEFQDTNHPQYYLLKLLSRDYKNVFVVGDDDQSIYGWRGAKIENIRKFQQEFDADIIRLERNYRSSGHILNAANSIVCSIEGRMSKTLKAERDIGEKVILNCVGDDRLQAAYVFEEIKKMIASKNKSYHDFAVLYRTNAQSRVLEEVFTRHQIPYKIYGGQRFFDRAEIKDILCYLRIIVNPKDAEAFWRIVNVPKRKIGEVGKQKIQSFSEFYGITYDECCIRSSEINGLNKVAVQNLQDLGNILIELRKKTEDILPTQIIKIVIDSIKYFENYLILEYGKNEAEDRFQNIEELVNAVKVFEDANPGSSIADFLREASLLATSDESNVDKDNVVSLMTIHSSKGLEFSTVFVIGLTEGILPLSNNRDISDLDEEKRLLYVAITRAKDHLYLSYEKQSLRYGEFIYNERSHFLDHIPKDVIKEITSEKSYHQKDKFRKKIEASSSRKSDAYNQQKVDEVDENIKLAKISSFSEIEVGEYVMHSVFGKGQVDYISDAMIRIIFDRFGKQVLMGSTLSNLKKIV